MKTINTGKHVSTKMAAMMIISYCLFTQSFLSFRSILLSLSSTQSSYINMIILQRSCKASMAFVTARSLRTLSRIFSYASVSWPNSGSGLLLRLLVRL